jgi:tetratricopeptide (TPR) repeat protein
MKKVIAILMVGFLALTLQAQNPKKSYKNAKKLFDEGQYAGALTELNTAIELNISYTEAYVLRAQTNEKLENLEQAAGDFEKAASLDPKMVDYYFQAGRTNYLIKNYERSLKYLGEATTLDSKNFQALQYKSFAHIKLDEYQKAIVAIDNALLVEQTYMCYYVRAVAQDSLGNYTQAISDYSKAIGMNPNYQKAFFAMAKTYLKNNQNDEALDIANRTVQKFPTTAEAYEVRSFVYYNRGELLSAINDLSKLETMVDDVVPVLCTRGIYYFEFEQFQNAKSDFSQLMVKAPEKVEAIYWRARSNEEMMESDQAIADFEHYLSIAKPEKNKYIEDTQKRLFDLKREALAPVFAIDTPMVLDGYKLAVLKGADRIEITGHIVDASDIASFTINGTAVQLNNDKSFKYLLNIAGINSADFLATDIYKNTAHQLYDFLKMENDLPIVRITTPYASDNGEVYLDSDDPNLFVEGFIEDESFIKEIYIDGVRASFNDSELNPHFTATLDLTEKDKIVVMATDAFNNVSEKSFTLNREGAAIAEDNPMGKTWVVFIENSNYETFASLEGPTKDVATMKAALSKYEVHNFIHKTDMTKKDMERFFSIELRDQVKKNNVNSLLVWYAGHGKFINETGYWIPTDATRDDEFTYFNINALKAGMQSYSQVITHTLVVTDACESGPSFYQAMRATNDIRACDDVNATKFKSSQVFSSAGYELASDNSQFTKTFAKSLQFNEDVCIPIESIVNQVTEAVSTNEAQKPQFGKIAGLEDENGTFFFIRK